MRGEFDEPVVLDYDVCVKGFWDALERGVQNEDIFSENRVCDRWYEIQCLDREALKKKSSYKPFNLDAQSTRPNYLGYTPLCISVARNCPYTVSMFLSSGADVNASSLDHKHANNSVTPFHLSARACCSVNHRDLQGREFWSIPALEIMQNLLRHKQHENTFFVDIFATVKGGRLFIICVKTQTAMFALQNLF